MQPQNPYRADHRETVPLICNAQYTIKILVLIEKRCRKYGLGMF